MNNTYSIKIGSVTVSLLSDGPHDVERQILIGVLPEWGVAAAKDGRFRGSMNCYLMQMDDRRILVDAGIGKNIEENLRALHIMPQEIDVILITHMHPDHIGGLLKDGAPLFPQASVYVPRQEYDYWVRGTGPAGKQGIPDQVATAYHGRITLFDPGTWEEEGRPVIPGVRAVAAFGHTPGHTMFLAGSGASAFLIWGDIVHAIDIQIPHPEVAVTYDTDFREAVATRNRVLAQVSARGMTVFGMHVPYPGCFTVGKGEGGYRFTMFQ